MRIRVELRNGKSGEAEFPFLGTGSPEDILESLGEDWVDQAALEKGQAFARGVLTTLVNKDTHQDQINQICAKSKPGTRMTPADRMIETFNSLSVDEQARIRATLLAKSDDKEKKAKAA